MLSHHWDQARILELREGLDGEETSVVMESGDSISWKKQQQSSVTACEMMYGKLSVHIKACCVAVVIFFSL